MTLTSPTVSTRLRRGLSAVLVAGAAAGMSVAGVGAARAAPVCPTNLNAPVAVSETVAALGETCTQAQFDSLFGRLPAGPLPTNVVMNGQTRPVGAPNPTAMAAAAAVWSGKHFYDGWLNNRVLGGEGVAANVRYGLSAIDRKPVVWIDYSRSGLPFAHDELRRMPNGVYLGYGFLNNVPQVDFWVWR
ncbi:hypothetical protein [Gordonia rhizosphera]|uniref:CAP domain-containing protein n=1 Tax=Gordonia rhizosphera NBRC 16068 TaxID=1108045 RepID=K6VCG8_9ACTN|nr:hypothetical protein [Gordonia rhizosphera]GAB93893.1 hypothetical protein GORHZ_247_00310 [Gordonia rhizosphera NBRC 16068]